MNLNDALNLLPDGKGAVVILSGGMDSTIATILAVKKYGKENVRALSFDYRQKQRVEILRAKNTTNSLGIQHKILDLSILGDISMGFSSNVDPELQTPTIEEVLGDPQPTTYVPNRNMILMSFAAAYAETCNLDTIVCGLQQNDLYSYSDTTITFLKKINDVLAENRKIRIKVVAPFHTMTKKDELLILRELNGNLKALENTLTCYDPDTMGRSCGVCPSCAERLKAFQEIGEKDPVSYVT